MEHDDENQSRPQTIAEVIAARRSGLNPEAIARARAEDDRLRDARLRSEKAASRLVVLMLGCVMLFAAAAVQMVRVATSEPIETRSPYHGEGIAAGRADIVDRNGLVLATNLPVWSVYARPQEMIDPAAAAKGLAQIFPDLDEARLRRSFEDGRRFVWVKKAVTPAQRLAVHDLGEPGLLFGSREQRFYPNGRMAAHILGGASYGEEGVHSAEIIGVAGVENALDSRLRDPALAATPLRLSVDLRVQAALTDVLENAVSQYEAIGAAGVMMKVDTGEVLAMVSLPDFDPNHRPRPATSGYAEDQLIFNRAAQGVYELGSTYKIFTAAMMMEAGLATPETMVDTKGPLRYGRFSISESHAMPPEMSLHDVIVESSNVGTANLARLAGASRQRAFLQKFGLLTPTTIELPEAAQAQPLLPERWSEISTMTISFGHGTAATPLHLAAAYAAIANGGIRIEPTLLAVDEKHPHTLDEANRVLSPALARSAIDMLRDVVLEGTGKNAAVKGYELAGKTGSAEKPRRDGRGYDHHKVLATFAGMLPASDPKYVIVITLDEGKTKAFGRTWRTAGWTAAPTTQKAVARIMPLLDEWPKSDTVALDLETDKAHSASQ